MRIAVIGCGRISQVAHLPALAKIPGLELVAAVDASADLAKGVASRYGGIALTSVEDCFAETSPDAVLVTVPDRLHASVVEQALASGRHVLVEKPMTATLAEAMRLVQVADRSGHVLQVGNMKRHDPGIAYARRVLQERLGDVLSFSAWYRTTSMRDNAPNAFFPPLVKDPEVTTREAEFKADTSKYWLATHGAHLWDTVRYLLGEVSALRARRARVGSDLSWQAVVQLDNGGVGTADLTVNSHGEGSEGMSVRCSKGTLEMRTYTPFAHRASEVRVYEDNTGEVARPVLGYANAFERQLRAFAAWAASGGKDQEDKVVASWGTAAGAHDGLAAVRLLDAVARSVESGEEIVLDG